MLRYLISYPKKIFRSLDLRSQISKRIMWIISKSHCEFFFIYIFAIHLSSRHEKCCQISVSLLPYFKALETNGEVAIRSAAIISYLPKHKAKNRLKQKSIQNFFLFLAKKVKNQSFLTIKFLVRITFRNSDFVKKCNFHFIKDFAPY